MPITSSATKALRASKKKRVFNLRRQKAIEDSEKKILKLIKQNKFDEAKKALSEVYTALDKGAKTNLIKKNTASRKKSRLSAMLKKASKK